MENKDQGNIVPPEGVGGVHTPPSYNVVSETPFVGALSLEEPGTSQPLIVEQSHTRGKVRLLFATHGKLMAMIILLILLGAAVVGALFWDRESDQKKQLPSASRFNSVTLPLGELLNGKDLSIAGTSNVTINGTLQVKGGLLLAPSLQPTGAKPGQIYYDQGSQQLAYYNGSNFVFLNEARNGSVQSLGGATGQLVLGAGLTMAGNQLTNTGVLSVQGSTGNITFTAGPGLVINGTNFSNSGVLSIAAGTPNVTVQNVDGAVTISVTSPIAGTGTVTSSGGTNGVIPIFTASQNIEDSIITQAGLGISIGGDLQVTGNVTLSNALTVGQGGTGATTLTANGVLVGNGASPVSSVAAGGAGLCLLSTAGAPTWGVCPGGGGVTTLNGLAGALTIANSSGAGSTITIDDATTSSKGIASFNSTNFSVTSGAVNTVQNINTAATPTFAGVNTNAINPSSALTVGATGQVLLLQGNASTQLRANNGANSTTVSFQSPTASVTYRFLTASAGSYDICTTAGNCVGTGGGVTTTGGTTNRVAKFSAGQAINDSTITDDGTNVLTSVDMVIQGGDLTIGVPTTQTGTINLANNGSGFLGSIVQGALSGNRTYTLPDASGTICLSSGNCTASGVTSLNGLVGALNIANASATGSTITIDDASTTTKGIASFNSTNFSVTGGAVNTIQNINTTASPTFTAINTNTITPSGALTVGAVGQTATLSGSITTISSNGAGNNIILNSANTIELQGTSNVTGDADISGTLAVGTGNAFQVAANGNITTAGTALVSGANLTVGGNAQAGSLILNDGSANTGTLNTAALGQDTVYVLPDPGTGTVSICLTSGNCAGTGGGVTTTGGTTNRLAKFSGSQAIADSTISDNGTNVTTSVDLIIQGGDVTVGVANSQVGTINLAHNSSAFLGSILQGALTANRTYTLPDASGTICLSSGNCSGSGSSSTLQAAYDAGNTITTTDARDISFALSNTATDSNFNIDIATDSTGTVAIRRANGAGTNDPAQLLLLDNLDTDRLQPTGLRIQSSAGGITTAIDVSDPEIVVALSTGANDISGTNYSLAGATGNITTAGDLAVNGGDITSTGALNITPAGTLTVGVAGQQIILQGNASTQLIANGGGFATTIGFTGTPTGNINYNFDRASTAGTYTICTTASVCGGYQSPLTFNNGLTNTSGTVQLGGSLIQNTTLAAGLFGLTLTSDLTSANRTTPVVSITQANGANFATTPLFSVTNSDTNSNLELVSFTHNPSSAGTVLSLNGSATTGLLVNTGGGAAARGINVSTSMTSGTGIRIDSSTATSGLGLSIEGSNTATLSAFTGSMLQIAPTKQLIGGSGTLTDTGNYLKIARSNTVNSAGRTWNNTGDLAVFSSNCTQTAGTCTDSGRILSLNQQYASATGTVLSVQNAGSGSLLELGSSSTVLARFASNGNLTLGSTSTAGDLFLTDGTGNAFTNNLGTTTLTASRTIDLPDASGTVCLQGSSACGFLTGSATDYIQNQNSVSQTANWRISGTGRADTALQAPLLDTASAGALAIGTTNANAINLQQNTTLASGRTLTVQGGFTMTPSTDTTSIFNIRTSGSNNMFTVDTQNARIGIGLGGSNVPTLADAGVEIKGALRLSGGNGTYADTYVTPNGGTVNTVINIVNYDPGASAQIVAMGLPSTANATARVISLFDARSGAHQPTLAVLSPDQNQIAGFSWDGSNATFLTKTSSNNMALQANGLNILTLQNVSSAARLGIGNGTPGYALDVTGDANISSGSAYKINGTDICTASGCVPVATCDPTGNYICNGGNTPVSSVAIGTTNAQPLNFMTNSGTRASISSTGIFQVFGNGTGSARIGGDCSSNYTAINLGGTTPFDCTSYNFLSGPTDASLYINRPSGSSVFIREGNSSTNQMSISGGGALTAQNTTDTTAGFRVLNAGSVPLFQIDTSNSRVYIGDPVADTTGALLVLDTKTSAGDPTGVNGGMYYNSALGKMRCYENNGWRDCVESARTGFSYTADLFTTAGDAIVGISSGGTGSSNNNIASIAGHQGIIRLSTGTTNGGWGNVGSNDAGQAYVFGSEAWHYETVLRVTTLSNGTDTFVVRAGFGDSGLTDGNNGCFFRYTHSVQSGNWQGVCRQAGVSTTCDTGTAVVAGTWYRLNVTANAAATSVNFSVNGGAGCTISTGIPSGTGQEMSWNTTISKTAGTTARTMDVDYVEMRNQYPTSR